MTARVAEQAEVPTTRLIRFLCYAHRQEARAKAPCITLGEALLFVADARNKQAAAVALVRDAARLGLITSGRDRVAKTTIWRLTPAGRDAARNAPPDVAAWRVTAPKAGNSPVAPRSEPLAGFGGVLAIGGERTATQRGCTGGKTGVGR
jgi:hypothetical protein